MVPALRDNDDSFAPNCAANVAARATAPSADVSFRCFKKRVLKSNPSLPSSVAFLLVVVEPPLAAPDNKSKDERQKNAASNPHISNDDCKDQGH
jgi:hypothetical protein